MRGEGEGWVGGVPSEIVEGLRFLGLLNCFWSSLFNELSTVIIILSYESHMIRVSEFLLINIV